jgi:hypothetical protein
MSSVANVAMVVVYFIYFRGMVYGPTRPNPATWIIWVGANAVNAFSYRAVVGDISAAVLPYIVLLLSIGISVYAFTRGKFSRLEPLEVGALVVALAVGVLWRVTGDARFANLSIQVVYAISYVPLVVRFVRGTAREDPAPWIIAVIAFVFMVVSIFVSGNRDPAAFVYPIVNGILGNGTIVVLAIRERSKTEPD